MGADLGHRLVFVGGLHRSGTTPLTRALGRHPDISAFDGTGVKEDEGQHLQDVYPSAREFGGAGRFGFDERAHLTEDSPLATPENAAKLITQWSPHWDPNAPVWIEKSPPNLIMTRYLQALFPQARFIMIVRHPVVVALSTIKWRRSMSLPRLIDHWLRTHELFVEDSRQIGQLHVVQYERLVDAPDAALEDIASFLGLSGSIPADTLQRGRSDVYTNAWQQLRRSRLPWKSAQGRRIIAAYAERVAAFGYDMRDLDRLPAPYVRGELQAGETDG